MQCRRCGKETGDDTRCTFCGYNNIEGNVREMTNTEKNFYEGVTIDTGETEEQSSNNQKTYNYNSYRRKTNYNPGFSRRKIYTSSGSGLFSKMLEKLLLGLINNDLIVKIAVTLIAVALAALMFFVALPILFLMLAMGIALFVLSKMGR